MATAATGWYCTHSASIISQTDTTATIRVQGYWQNDGWNYHVNLVYAYVYCNGVEHCVKSGDWVDSRSSNSAKVSVGYHDFTVNKTTVTQSISCYARIDCNSSYSPYDRSSSATRVSVGAKTKYTVSYDVNGGKNGPGNQTKWHGTNINISSTKPTRDGYTFVRWNTDKSNTGTAYNPGVVYSANANVTLYAIWQINTYTVSYNKNTTETVSGMPSNQTKTYGTNLPLSSSVPTRTNYNFKGWATSANGSVSYAAGGTYTNNSAVTLYAVWEVAYKKPRISNFKAFRCTSDGTTSETGTYVKVMFDWATDITIMTIGADLGTNSNFNEYDWYSFKSVSSGTSGSINQVIGNGSVNTETTYYIRVYVDDGTGNSHSAILTIGTVKFPIDIKSGGTGVAIGKVSEKDAFEIGMEIFDRFNTHIGNGLADYKTGGSHIDANTTITHLILTNVNTPNNAFFYVLTFFYNNKTTTSNKTQIAIPYITNLSLYERDTYIRHSSGGSWTPWSHAFKPVIMTLGLSARYTLSADAWASTKITLNQVHNESASGILSLTDNGIKISSDVSRMKVSGSLSYFNYNATGETDIYIKRIRDGSLGICAQAHVEASAANKIHRLTIPPIVVSAQNGDIVQLHLSKSTANDMTILDNYASTSLTVEIIV